MARTALTKTPAPNMHSTTGSEVTMAVADTTDKNQFVSSSDDLVIAHNAGASSHTVTITSTVDPYGRTGDVDAQSLAAGEIRVFRLAHSGWAQSNGQVYLEADSAEVKFGVVTLR